MEFFATIWREKLAHSRVFAIVCGLVFFLAINIFVNLALSDARLDATENQSFTLDDATLQLLDRIEEPITFVYFRSDLLRAIDPKLASYADRVQTFLTNLARSHDNKVRLEIRRPEPFSEAEDEALAMDLTPIPTAITAENAYFALAATDSIDRLATIDRLDPDREELLAADIRQLLGEIIFAEKPVVELVSELPVLSNASTAPPSWGIARDLQRLYRLRSRRDGPSWPGEDIDGLWIVEPANLTPAEMTNVEIFAQDGGGVLIFLDPAFTAESALRSWLTDLGLTLAVSDHEAAGDNGAVTMLDDRRISAESPITRDLSAIALRGAGEIEVQESADPHVEPLFFARINGDDVNRALAVRLDTGMGDIIVVADVDMLRDEVWRSASANGATRRFGLPTAENGRFVVASLDHLTGRSISFESAEKQIGRRPFTRFDAIRQQTTERFRRSELELLHEIERLEEALVERDVAEAPTSMIEAFADQTSFAGLRDELVATKIRLREIRRAQQDEIDALERRLTFFAVALAPLLVGLLGIVLLILRWLRFRSRHEAALS